MPVHGHQHAKCPRCHVSLGRYDTICWACHHVLKAPGIPIKYVWVWRSVLAIAGAITVILAIKYRMQFLAIVQDTIRSAIKGH